MPDEGALIRSLRAATEPQAEGSFRDRLRSQFLDASIGGIESRDCKQSRRGELSMDEFENQLRDTIAQPAADPAYQAELKRRFVDFSSVAKAESRGLTEAAGRPRGRLFRLGVIIAAAAAALFVTFYLPEEARWSLEGAPGLEEVLVDGNPLGQGGVLGPGAEQELLASLGRGAHLVTGAGALDLNLSMGMRMRVLPGTSVSFLGLPEPGSPQELGFVLERGEVFLETDKSYAGNPIRIETSDVEVMVTGTALGVMVDERGTCTCVDHGEVAVTRADRLSEAAESVSSRHLLFVLRDAECMRKSFDSLEDAEHVHPLEEFAALK